MALLDDGVDAPRDLVTRAAAGGVFLALGTVWPIAQWPAGFLLFYSAGQFFVSVYGKQRTVRRMLDRLPWRGDEHVLDVGCGHGLLLVEAARRLTTGRAVGIDVWSQRDQWRNTADATRARLRAAGLGDKVEVQDADARELPFADASFDVVVSNLVIHNIPGEDERARAIREVARVLKPGGRVALVDIAHTRHYAEVLRAEGFVDVHRGAVPLMVWPGARRLTATKPG
ncbi:MAG: arsenite methyltransferase [Actinomycetota bacterium]|jgi:ubiquinone/menaquinone biosynthesis C-methylase UbiE